MSRVDLARSLVHAGQRHRHPHLGIDQPQHVRNARSPARRPAHRPRRGRAARSRRRARASARRRAPNARRHRRAPASVRRRRRRSRGKARALDSAPSSCRPPWLETTIPSAPLSAASRASSGSRMPLMTSGPCHCARTHSTSFQVTLASKLRANPARKSASGARLPTIGSRLPRLMRPAAQSRRPTPVRAGAAPAPSRWPGRASTRQPERSRDSAIPARQIDGEQQRAAARLLRARDHVATKPRSLTM